MRPIFAIDGGNKYSGFAILESKTHILRNQGDLTFGKIVNEELIPIIRKWVDKVDFALEFPYPRRGQLVAYEVFLMTAWLGRFQQVIEDAGGRHYKIFRHRTKSVLCRSGAANDSQISCAVRDLIGPKGTVKLPGPTYGVSHDVWQALAVGITFACEGDSEQVAEEKKKQAPPHKPKVAF